MKKFIIAMLIMLTGVAAASARDSYSRDIKVLPAAAQNFIARNFKAKVNLIKIDSGTFSSTDYDVILTDGSEIDFDSAGNWKDIEVGRSAKVPDAAVPEATRRYVKQNHPKAKIVGIERSRSGFKIELSDGIEFETDRAGAFRRYDD